MHTTSTGNIAVVVQCISEGVCSSVMALTSGRPRTPLHSTVSLLYALTLSASTIPLTPMLWSSRPHALYYRRTLTASSTYTVLVVSSLYQSTGWIHSPTWCTKKQCIDIVWDVGPTWWGVTLLVVMSAVLSVAYTIVLTPSHVHEGRVLYLYCTLLRTLPYYQ